MDTSDNYKPPDKKPPLPVNNDPGSIERFIENLEKEVSFIETQEIVKGFMAEELEQKGFIGDKSIFIERSEFSCGREKAGFDFEEATEYAVKDGLKDIGDVDFEDLVCLKDVQQGQIIAYRKLPKSASDSDLNKILSIYNEKYVKKANILLKKDDDRMQFVAAVKGKTVVMDEFLFVVSSDRNARYSMQIAADRMRAVADFIPAFGNGRHLENMDVIAQLRDQGVTSGINETMIAETIEKLKKDNKVEAAERVRKLSDEITSLLGKKP